MSGDKRSSTGNLFFTDQFDNHPWEAPPDINLKTPAWPPRRRNLSSQENSGRTGSGSGGGGAGGGGGGGDVEVKDPAATLQAMAGEWQPLHCCGDNGDNVPLYQSSSCQ